MMEKVTKNLCILVCIMQMRKKQPTHGLAGGPSIAPLKVLKPQLECQLKPIGAMGQNATPSDMSLDD